MWKQLELRAFNSYDTDLASNETAISFEGDEGKTQQEFKDEADINTIVRRFGLTGMLPDSPRVPMSGDFTGISDYQTALNAVIAADAAFMALPADMRARFQNDPQELLMFLEDPKNADEGRKLGLLKAVEIPPVVAAVVPPVA